MPQFNVAKTDKMNKIENNIKKEDRLYIYKETNKIGHIFYDYDNDTRIRIGTTDVMYYSIKTLTKTEETLKIDEFGIWVNNTLKIMDIAEIQMNALITDNYSLSYITNIDTENQTVHVRKIYIEQSLRWNDYYE